MRITFYYDDLPEGNNVLLRLDNPALAQGYVTYLNASYSEERLSHIRVRTEKPDIRNVCDYGLKSFERMMAA